jgi:hypothetical protein
MCIQGLGHFSQFIINFNETMKCYLQSISITAYDLCKFNKDLKGYKNFGAGEVV